MAILKPQSCPNNSTTLLSELESRRSRQVGDYLDPILKKIFEKFNLPFTEWGKLYAFPEEEIIKYFERYPELLDREEFRLINEKLIAHYDEIKNSSFEPYVRKRFFHFLKEFERLPLLEDMAPG